MKEDPKKQELCTCNGTCPFNRLKWVLVMMIATCVVIFLTLSNFFEIKPAKAATKSAGAITHECPTNGCEKPDLTRKVKETNVYYLVYVNQVDHEYYHIDSFSTEEECFDARASPDYKNFVTEAIGVEDPILICQMARMAFDTD